MCLSMGWGGWRGKVGILRRSGEMPNAMTSTFFRSACSIICIKCRRRCETCTCCGGEPDERGPGKLHRGATPGTVEDAKGISRSHAVGRQQGADPCFAGRHRHPDRARVKTMGLRRTGCHDPVAASGGERYNNRRAQLAYILPASPAGGTGSVGGKRLSDGGGAGPWRGDRDRRDTTVFSAAVFALHHARRRVVSGHPAHLLCDSGGTGGAGGVAPLHGVQRNSNPDAIRHTRRPSDFSLPASIQSLYGGYRLHRRVDPGVLFDGLPRAPCVSVSGASSDVKRER